MHLHESLRYRRLVIVGDPGSGKTTFLRRIACEMSIGRVYSPGSAAWLAPDERRCRSLSGCRT